MVEKLQGQLTVLKMRREIYRDMAEAKKIERDEHNMFSAMYQILDCSYARLEARAELTEEHIIELEALLEEIKQEA